MNCQHDPMLEDCTLRIYSAGTCVELYCTACKCCTKDRLRPAEEWTAILEAP